MCNIQYCFYYSILILIAKCFISYINQKSYYVFFFFCWTIALSTDWLGKTISNCLAEPIFLILKLLGKTITLSYRVCLFAAFCISKTMEIVLLTLDFVCVVRISARQFKLSYRDCNLCLSYCYVYISLQDNRARQFLLSCPILHLLH